MENNTRIHELLQSIEGLKMREMNVATLMMQSAPEQEIQEAIKSASEKYGITDKDITDKVQSFINLMNDSTAEQIQEALKVASEKYGITDDLINQSMGGDSSNASANEALDEQYDLVLTKVDISKKIATIKAIKNAAQLALVEAKEKFEAVEAGKDKFVLLKGVKKNDPSIAAVEAEFAACQSTLEMIKN